MNKKETIEMPLLNRDHMHHLLKRLCVVYQDTKELDNGKQDETFVKAVKHGTNRVFRELYQAGESDLAKQALEIARDADA